MPDLKSTLDIITSFITILGVPAGIYIYYSDKKKERAQKESAVYDSLDDKYIDFLKLCIEHPELKLSAGSNEDDAKLTDAQQYQKLSAYEILISLLERADILYRDQSDEIKKRQYKGWQAYQRDWMQTKSFRQAWNQLGAQYEETFAGSMNQLYQQYNN